MIPIPSNGHFLRVDVKNTVSNALLTCRIFGNIDGTPYVDSFAVIPSTTDASWFTGARRSLPQSLELYSVVVICETANVQRGQIYVRANVFYGDTDTYPAIGLFSDYVTSNSSPSFPETGMVDSLSGMGYFKLYSSGPTPGDETLVFTPESNRILKPLSMKIGLTTSVAVATRRLNASLVTSSGQDMEVTSNITQAASLTYRYNVCFPYYQNPTVAVGANNNVYLPLPETMIDSGGQAYCTVDNGDANDVLTGSLFVEQWIKS